MMRTVRRLRFEPVDIAPRGATLIDRYLGRDDHARRGVWVPAPGGLETIDVALTDTGEIATSDNGATIWHVLWVRDEASSTVTIGAGGDAGTWPIAPGDSVVAPTGMPLRTDGRQLAIQIRVPGAGESPAPPTHGEERYFGYNRQTVCCRAGAIRLCRWKLTQPLALRDHHPTPTLVLALARDSVIRTANAIERLAQGELALIDPVANPVVMPDGLSYLLTIDRES